VSEHVILVAFSVEAPSRTEAQEMLLPALPRPGAIVTSWWVAEDDRIDGSDNDSAVFVPPGAQHKVSSILVNVGLTPACNLVPDEPTRFELT